MKTKFFFLIFILILIASNFYFFRFKQDIFTQAKVQASKIDGKTSYLGKFKLWQILVYGNDWTNASILEPDLNPKQVQDYKLANQPEELQKKIDELNKKTSPTADDFLEIARIQSILGSPEKSIDAIKKAHQLDPIRPDVDKLFYTLTN